MSLNLYLLRHGETTYSRSGGHCGWIDPDLTPEGQQMAAAFAGLGQDQSILIATRFAASVKQRLLPALTTSESSLRAAH